MIVVYFDNFGLGFITRHECKNMADAMSYVKCML